VIVDDFDVMRIAIAPAEADAPLAVDADAVLSFAIALQRFQPVARRRLQVDAVLQPDAPAAVDRALEIEELTAVLDGLTNNALSGGKRSR